MFTASNIKRMLFAGAALSLFCIFPSYARTINYVRIEEQYTPYVRVCNINELYFTTYQEQQYDLMFELSVDNESYTEGDVIPVSFTLTAKDGYDFKDIKIGSCKINDSINFYEMHLSSDNRTLMLSGEIPALQVGLEKPQGLELTRSGRASWEPVDKADHYEITVKVINDRGGLDYKKSYDSQGPSFDLKNYIYSDPGDYVYTVVAKSDKSYLLDSSEAELPRSRSVLLTREDIGYSSSAWGTEGRVLINGGYVKDSILKICGSWYWIGEDTYPETGWRKACDNEWEYYDRETKKRAEGLTEIEGNTFYFDPETGIMQTGFVDVDGKEVFFAENGAKKTGWVYYKGKVYYIEKDGKRNFEQLINNACGEVYIFDPEDGHLLTTES